MQIQLGVSGDIKTHVCVVHTRVLISLYQFITHILWFRFLCMYLGYPACVKERTNIRYVHTYYTTQLCTQNNMQWTAMERQICV